MRSSLILVVLILPFVFGCDAARPTPRPQEVPDAVEVPIPEPVEDKSPEPETIRVEAAVGMTGKGQYDHGGGEKPMDIILVPVSQLFQARERIVLQQIQHAEDLYKAGHDNKLPGTHEEYMKDVLQGMPLPKLPDGHQFVYDPEKQQLMVEKPK